MTNGTSKRILGAVESLPADKFSGDRRENPKPIGGSAKIASYCSETPGIVCGEEAREVRTYDTYNACGPAPQTVGVAAVKGGLVVNGEQSLNAAMGIAADPFDKNKVVIADTGNHRVRWLNINTRQTGVLAGNGTADDLGDGGSAEKASLRHPKGVAYDAAGNLYISTQSGLIRKVDINKKISTIAGDSRNGKLAMETPALEALFNNPYGLVVDNKKNILYVADSGHHRVVAINLTSGLATTVAGNGSSISSGDGGSALDAGIHAPSLLGLDLDGNLLVI